jgi:hypothetical protein
LYVVLFWQLGKALQTDQHPTAESEEHVDDVSVERMRIVHVCTSIGLLADGRFG